jgi:hypothetical protein
MGLSGDAKLARISNQVGQTQNGKGAMDRHGIFSELGYISIGDRYPKVELGSKPFHTSASIGKQMMTGFHTNSQSPCQAGYFDSQFNRIMANEALSDPIKEAHKERLLRKKKRIGRGIWIPSNGEKKASGSGNHYGTIGGKIPHFSAENKEKIKLEKAKANVLTNPPKKGSGYGYANVTLNPYHEHKTDPYDGPKEQRADENRDHRRRLRGGAFKLNNHPKPYFDLNPFKPTRIPQTSESMTKLNVYEKKHKPFQTTFTPCRPFHRHPAHMPNGGETHPTRRNKPYTKVFAPTSGSKSRPTPSIIEENIRKEINKSNFKSIRNNILNN